MIVITLLVLVAIAVVVVLGLMFVGVLGTGRAPSEVVDETPKADLLGPGGADDPDADENETPANDPEAPTHHQVSSTG